MKWLVYAEPYNCPRCTNTVVIVHIASDKNDALEFIQRRKTDQYKCRTPNCNICNGHHYIFRLAKIKKEIIGK